MNYTREEYSAHYITDALFKLMESSPYSDITVSDVAKKAGVGRATFYRYFSCKEDVVRYFFDRTKSEFSDEQIYRPRSKEDYEDVIRRVIRYIRIHKKRLRLLIEAHLDYIYKDYVTAALTKNFKDELDGGSSYLAAGYAGAISEITLHWVKNDCNDDERIVFDAFVAVALGGSVK